MQSWGWQGPQEPPSTLDYDLWTGPAELRPLMRQKLHYDWHWDFNTGNGDIGNQGVHQMDIARWGLGKTHVVLGDVAAARSQLERAVGIYEAKWGANHRDTCRCRETLASLS